MQGIADIFLSFFYFSGACLSAISPPAFLSSADGEQRSCRADCRRKPSLHAALGGFPLSHRMRKRIGGVRRTLSARLFPKKYDRQCFAGKLPPPLSGRCKTKRKPETREGFRLPVSYSAIICSTRQPISVRRPRCRRRSPF